MSFRNLDAIRKYGNRRSERMAAEGIKLEDEVERLLARMQKDGKILRFVRHAHNSPEDWSGKDFTVVFGDGNAEVERSFGVTISSKSWQAGKSRHPGVTQFCWPIGTNLTTMENRILGLLQKPNR
jgi:thiamine biosynthesis lipoprotein ApbE